MSDYYDKKDRYLWLEHDDSPGDAKIIFLRFRYLDQQDRVSCFNSTYFDTQGGGYDFEQLTIRAQYDRMDTHNYGLYGWGVSYRNRYYIDLREARVMVKTLNRIETGLSRVHDTHGPPLAFSQYVLRIANLFKVKAIMRNISGKEALMMGQNYKLHKLPDTGYAIGLLLNEYGMFDKEKIANV